MNLQIECNQNFSLIQNQGIDSGDIGLKGGFESVDNGYVRFNQVRIPRTNLLMKYSTVTPDGKFSRQGNQMVIYASMLLLRGALAFYISSLLSISTTIAIRYSCVRRQTADMEGLELFYYFLSNQL